MNRKKYANITLTKVKGKPLVAYINDYNTIVKQLRATNNYPLDVDLQESRAEFIKGLQAFLRRCVCNRSRHQWCLSHNAVNLAVSRLQKHWPLPRYSSFEDLYDDLFSILTQPAPNGSPSGIGTSTVYDIALRLAYSLGLPIPKDYVYVHRHLKTVAKNILGGRYNLVKGYRIDRALFDLTSKRFVGMSAAEIEDFLCVYGKL